MKDYLKIYNQLNERQKSAVDDTEGPHLILAGPGTGKTQLLSVRAASIIESKKANPENILILTYTNAAAKAMKERLAAVIGLGGYDVEVGTFHSFANTLIQESEEAANYIGDKIQLSEVERMRVMEYILDNTEGLDEIRPFRAPYTYLKEILQRISDLKRDGISPAGLKGYLAGKDSLYRSFEEKYVKRLQALVKAYERDENPMVIGGAQVYVQAFPLVSTILVTCIDKDIVGDVYFPEIDMREWKMISTIDLTSEARFMHLDRI